MARGWVNIDQSWPEWADRLMHLAMRRPFRVREGYRNWDLRKGIPFADASVDVVYSSHVLEHIAHDAAPGFIAEMARVLRPGGIVRIVVPDLEQSAATYLRALSVVKSSDHTPAEAQRYELATLMLLDQMVRTRTGGELADWLRAHAGSPVVAERGGILQAISESKPPLHGFAAPVRSIARLFKMLDPGKRGEIHRWMYDEYSLTEALKRSGFQDIRRMLPDESRVAGWTSFHLDVDESGSVHQPGSLWLEGVK